jgi:hypothetical protein
MRNHVRTAEDLRIAAQLNPTRRRVVKTPRPCKRVRSVSLMEFECDLIIASQFAATPACRTAN